MNYIIVDWNFIPVAIVVGLMFLGLLMIKK